MSETEHPTLWQVAVRVPLSLPVEIRHQLFAVVSDAVAAWEPDDRDGWDADVSGAPLSDAVPGECTACGLSHPWACVECGEVLR